MTCREFVEFLWRYLEDELPPTERATFDDHMSRCPHCLKYVQQYQSTIHMGKVAVVASPDPIPTEVPEDLIQAILKAQTKAA
jgi:anti-sigma factor RsiW